MSAPRRLSLAFLLFMLVAFSCKVTRLTPVTFPPEYSPQEGSARFSVAPSCATYRNLTISDARTEMSVVGIRTLQEGPGEEPVVLDGDGLGWLRAVWSGPSAAEIVQSTLSRWELQVALASIRLEEVAFRNSEYEGRVILEVDVTEFSSGQPIWSQRYDGSSQNYGRPGSAENFRETMNHALDRAMIEMVTT